MRCGCGAAGRAGSPCCLTCLRLQAARQLYLGCGYRPAQDGVQLPAAVTPSRTAGDGADLLSWSARGHDTAVLRQAVVCRPNRAAVPQLARQLSQPSLELHTASFLGTGTGSCGHLLCELRQSASLVCGQHMQLQQ